jgi:hypothetical protein
LTCIKDACLKQNEIRAAQRRGSALAEESYPAAAHDYASDAEELEPRGALVLSLIAVGLLLIGWLGIYFLVFIPRGTVG